MNIFVLSRNPRLCAEMHCDKHVVKMILEYAQLLSAAHVILDDNQIGYKASHKKHPCTLWVMQSDTNYQWLHSLFVELTQEYTHRYEKIHKTSTLIPILAVSPKNIPIGVMTEFALAMPEDCYNTCAVTAYQNYYRQYKRHLAKWKNRSVPEWYI